MAKIQINLVSRIASDKDSFNILLQLAEKLTKENITDFELLFIGQISDEIIFHKILSQAENLKIADKLRFTKKSIPLIQLDDQTKSGYFFNFTVGLFLGYSSIDTVQLNLKGIFYNVDSRISLAKDSYINSCSNIDEVVTLIKSINSNKDQVDAEIYRNNVKMRIAFSLSYLEEQSLRSLLVPDKYK